MSAVQKLLTDHIDIWTTAETERKPGRGRSASNAGNVYGIKKLRELILELAVRGKLVPQDADDEPAKELLKKILAGMIKKPKLELDISDQEKPFELPFGWEWVHFGVVSEIERGGSPRPIKSYFTNDPDGLNWIKIGDTDQGGKYITSTNEKIRKEGLSKTRMVYPGDFLLTNSMSFGRPYITKIEGCIHDGWLRISPPEALDKDFLYYLLSSSYVRNVFIAVAAGAVVMNLNADKVRDLLIPVPPLAEQHRIVAKADELMALCDQLETRHSNAADAHEKLVSHLLGTLTQSQSVEDFNVNWQRISAHFDTLLTTEASIDALKQTLLQLAVMGKLVPQDPNDEPARELLKRIQAEKAKLIADGKIKKDKPLAELTEDEKPFELPKRWEWVRLGLLIQELSNGLYKPDKFYTDQGFISLRMFNIQGGNIDFDGARRVELDADELDQFILEAGDLLINRVNSKELVGKTAIIPKFNEALVYESMNMRARPYRGFVYSDYLNLYMKSSLAKETIFSFAKEAISQASINQMQIRSMPTPLPPLTEQHRIVAKVDELMTLCDQLKARLIDASQLQKKLADVLVKQAITE